MKFEIIDDVDREFINKIEYEFQLMIRYFSEVYDRFMLKNSLNLYLFHWSGCCKPIKQKPLYDIDKQHGEGCFNVLFEHTST